MLTPTYIITFDAGKNGKTEAWVQETKIGATESDVIDSIILGDCPLPYANIYRVAYDEVTEDVTDCIAAQVFQYALRKPISAEAARWLDWCGYDVQDAAE